MQNWQIALGCVMIVLAAILLVNLIKFIMDKTVGLHGTKLNHKKYEYLYATLGFTMAAAGVFCFLRFGAKIREMNYLVQSTLLYAGCVQTVYLFVVQLITKGVKGMANTLLAIFGKLTTSKDPLKALPGILEAELAQPEEEKKPETVKPEVVKPEVVKPVDKKPIIVELNPEFLEELKNHQEENKGTEEKTPIIAEIDKSFLEDYKKKQEEAKKKAEEEAKKKAEEEKLANTKPIIVQLDPEFLAQYQKQQEAKKAEKKEPIVVDLNKEFLEQYKDKADEAKKDKEKKLDELSTKVVEAIKEKAK